MDIAPPPPKQRYQHLRDPDLRKRSFGKWQKYTEQFIKELVDDGLFSIDEEKRKVQCVYCGGVLCGVEEGQKIHITHYRHFPKCDRFKYREPDFLNLFKNALANSDATVADGETGTMDITPYMIGKNGAGEGYYLDGRGQDTSHSVYELMICASATAVVVNWMNGKMVMTLNKNMTGGFPIYVHYTKQDRSDYQLRSDDK